jgi:hypothetical protein
MVLIQEHTKPYVDRHLKDIRDLLYEIGTQGIEESEIRNYME